MKRRILADVEVNNEDHANAIMADITDVVNKRTTIYQVGFDNERADNIGIIKKPEG